MNRAGSRSSTIVFERALATLARLLAGVADRQQLMQAVDEQVEDAYAQSPEDSFQRDLRLLRSLGFEVRWSRRRKVYSLKGLGHPVLRLHLPTEALEALALIKHTFSSLPHAQRFAALLAAIEERLPAQDQRLLERQPLPSYGLEAADSWQDHVASLQKVAEAIQGNQRLEFLYRSPKRPEQANPKRHIVEPFNLEYREGHLYFEGYHLKTGKVYPYRVDRIVPRTARVLPDKFPPRGPLKKPITVRYRLVPEIARYGASRRFLNQSEVRQDDGSVVVRGETYSLFGALKTLLKYGSGCRALEPPELVEMMREEAMKMVQMYERAPS